MSTIQETTVNAGASIVDEGGKQQSWFDRLEAKLEVLGDRLNPILVKESRQALKSRQFSVTFALLLICGWTWSFLGAVFSMPEIYYAPTGPRMLMGYYVILAIPLLVIVPFSAFRSLASEKEDGTYELLSITALNSRQIVTGKLGSSILQMIVYYSALAPCIVFTYLLRGVDIITIILLLFYTFLGSILFSAVGLMFAGLTGSRTWQMFVSVALLCVLGFATFGWFAMFFEIVDELDNVPYNQWEWWVGNAIVLTAYLMYLVIVILVGAAQNSFASYNRSTRLRIAMFVQTILFVGWCSWGWMMEPMWQALAAMMCIGTLHWYVYGIFLTGEGETLSPRVQRQLPHSFLGRMFFTWFNPGSGTGYIYTVCNVLLLAGIIIFAYVMQGTFGMPKPRWGPAASPVRAYESVILITEYLIIYLGIGRLFLLLVPRREQLGFLLPLIVHTFLAVAAIGIPFSIQMFSRRYINAGYTNIQIPNWGWTIAESMDSGLNNQAIPVILGVVAAGVFLVNLVLAAREIEAVRLATPERVRQDDMELENISTA